MLPRAVDLFYLFEFRINTFVDIIRSCLILIKVFTDGDAIRMYHIIPHISVVYMTSDIC